MTKPGGWGGRWVVGFPTNSAQVTGLHIRSWDIDTGGPAMASIWRRTTLAASAVALAALALSGCGSKDEPGPTGSGTPGGDSVIGGAPSSAAASPDGSSGGGAAAPAAPAEVPRVLVAVATPRRPIPRTRRRTCRNWSRRWPSRTTPASANWRYRRPWNRSGQTSPRAVTRTRSGPPSPVPTPARTRPPAWPATHTATRWRS